MPFHLAEQLWIEALSDSSRVKAEHGPKRKLSTSYLALRHGHEPSGGEYLVIAARPGLLLQSEK